MVFGSLSRKPTLDFIECKIPKLGDKIINVWINVDVGFAQLKASKDEQTVVTRNFLEKNKRLKKKYIRRSSEQKYKKRNADVKQMTKANIVCSNVN